MIEGALFGVALLFAAFLVIKTTGWIADHGTLVFWVLLLAGAAALFFWH